MAHLITGYRGEEHIQSKDVRSFNMAMFGDGEFVMEIGEQLNASIIDNNTVRVFDGDILMQGAHIRIDTNSYEDLVVDTGVAGYMRNDIICMTYEKNAEDTTETAYLEVVKGTQATSNPVDAEITTGVIADGETKNQMPLYRVRIEGVVLSSIEPLFNTIPTYKTLAINASTAYAERLAALKGSDILDSAEEIEANNEPLMFAGAVGVKQEISALKSSLTKNNFYDDFSITDYSQASPYTCPYDGYATVYNTSSNIGFVYVMSNSSTNKVGIGGAVGMFCVPVRKGMRLWVSGSPYIAKFNGL